MSVEIQYNSFAVPGGSGRIGGAKSVDEAIQRAEAYARDCLLSPENEFAAGRRGAEIKVYTLCRACDGCGRTAHRRSRRQIFPSFKPCKACNSDGVEAVHYHATLLKK
jgi:DnaJ-class molecular chaperone